MKKEGNLVCNNIITLYSHSEICMRLKNGQLTSGGQLMRNIKIIHRNSDKRVKNIKL